MGKKTKIGKQRKDKFYHLAKETGYRSRAAFKLLQLNRKFEFLQKSRVLVDLCAAPGGWMQVAVQNMPVSSLVIGVDLFPIKQVTGCIGIQEDITTPKCLQLIKKELKTWKADIVLNDGAPNVGQNWIHDAYQQNCLTLSALKLATDILRPGGFFVTKVFRSKDYNSLIWVFQQLFRNVYSTKPAASRNESAEIFVVCKGFLAPATLDPKFLDPKYAFEDVDMPQNKKQLQQLLLEVGKKKKPEGYPDGEIQLYKPINASEFVKSADHIELLGNTSEITIDEEWIASNPKTTEDIKNYCKDVKVLGKKEIKALVSWRKDLRDKWDQFMKLKSGGDDKSALELIAEPDEGSDTETKLEEALQTIRDEQHQEEKRKKKKLLKEIKKIQEKTSLDMIIPGDAGPTDTMEDSMFNLKVLRSMDDLEMLTSNPDMPETDAPEMNDEEEMEFYEEKRKKKIVRYQKTEEVLDSSGKFYKNADSAGDSGAESDDDEDDIDLKKGLGLDEDDDDMGVDAHTTASMDLDEEEESSPPLITDLDPRDKSVKRLKKAERWFANDIFKQISEDVDEDMEVNKLAESYIKKGAKVPGFEKDVRQEEADKESKKAQKLLKKTANNKRKAEMEVAVDDGAAVVSKKKKKLDVAGLALATVMVQSKKSRRDLMDEGWNRYAFNDAGLPEWFLDDEKKHMKKALPVPPGLVDEYKNSLKEINARPIKKVVEAKARKKKRTLKKMEKAKKKAEAILDKGELTDNEKANQIKSLYKKAKQTKKKEITYVVAKKFNSGKRMKRPAGVKGPMKVVDPRMKKDNRKMKTAPKPSNGKKSKGFKQANNKRGGRKNRGR